MTAIILPVPTQHHANSADASDQRVQVLVNVQAEVLSPEVARRKANVWLLENVGHLLATTTAELLLGERLYWRFEVDLEVPNLAQPGSGALYRIGQILLDAVTGEVQNGDVLAEELQTHAASLDQG
jgi:hypothetical protein